MGNVPKKKKSKYLLTTERAMDRIYLPWRMNDLRNSRMMPSDWRWERGEVTGLSCLIRLVWRKRKKESLGSAFERRVTDRIGGTISMVWIRARSAS